MQMPWHGAETHRTGLKDFTGLAHRQQKIAILDGISFVNDSKATNVDAAARAGKL